MDIKEMRRLVSQPRTWPGEWEDRRKLVLDSLDGTQQTKYDVRRKLGGNPGPWIDVVLCELVEDGLVQFEAVRRRGGATVVFWKESTDDR